MIVLLFFAFISGFFTILAPCIWPILPLVLSTSLGSTSHKRPLGITVGVMLSFSFFTLSLSTLISLFHFDPNVLRLIASIFIAFFGLTMLFPSLNTIMERVGKLVNWLGGGRTIRHNKDNDFFGGFITGAILGIIWSPCAGSILATIAVLSATSQVNLYVILLTLSYVSGIGIPLFAFAYFGTRLMGKLRFIAPQTGRLQQFFGIVTILTAILIYTNYDKVLQAKIIDYFPMYNNVLTGFENTKPVQKQLEILKNKKTTASSSGLSSYGQAPEFTGISHWIGVQKPLTLSDLKGKVVLVDFWTYTCINCIRTLPHVTSWYEKYKDQGFVVIGVHTPEFEFEKDTKNVEQAIKQYNIHYPVAQDNNYATWNAYNNQYWPAEYLIDGQGIIRRTHFGEGEYQETEKAIQDLLKEAGKKIDAKINGMPDETPKAQISPETYVGANRMEYLFPNGRVGEETAHFSADPTLVMNTFSFGGDWIVTSDQAITGQDSVLLYNFYAKNVFLVMRPPKNSKNAQVKVFLDGKMEGIITIDSDRLYNLIKLNSYGQHMLRLEFQTPGIEVYAFTFG